MKKTAAILCVLMFFLAAITGCQQKEEQKVVKIGYLQLAMSLPTFVAQEKGFFTDEGLQVELIPFNSATNIIEALMSNRIDANCGSSSTGHWFPAQTAPDAFKFFLMFGTDSKEADNTFVVVVKKNSDIQDFKDLKGKKVATFPGATNVSLAKICIRTQINPDEILFTVLAPPDMPPALAAGNIDAFFSPEPLGMMAVGKGVGRYLMKSPLTLLNLENGVPGGAFSFTTEFLNDNPKTAKKVKKAIEKAVDYIRDNEKEVRPYIAKYTALPEPVAMRLPLDKWMKLSEYNKTAGQEYFDLLYKEGAYKTKVDTTKLYYD